MHKVKLIIPEISEKGRGRLPSLALCKVKLQVKLPGETEYMAPAYINKRNAQNSQKILVGGKPVIVDELITDTTVVEVPTGSCVRYEIMELSSLYQFIGWNQQTTDPELVYEVDLVDEDIKINMFFDGLGTTYLLDIIGDPFRGVVSGAGLYQKGAYVEIKASSFNGKYFKGWSDGSTDAVRTILITGPMTLTAEFGEGSGPGPEPETTYTLITHSDEDEGFVLGAGVYAEGSSAEVRAIPQKGYKFDHWDIDGREFTENPLTIVMTDNVEVTAVFAADPVVVLDVTCEPEQGVVFGGGSYVPGTSVTIQAFPKANYRFLHWMIDGNPVSTNPHTLTVTEDKVITAEFTYTPKMNVNVQYDHLMGLVNGGGLYEYNEQVTLEAVPRAGYAFKRYLINGQEIFNPKVTFRVLNDVDVIVEFESEEAQATLTIVYNSMQGVVSGAGTYPIGTRVNVAALAREGYKFDHFAGFVYTDQPELNIVLTRSVSLEVFFTPIYTGSVDEAGLRAIGWDEEDINLLKENICWDAEDDDLYKVPQQLKNWYTMQPKYPDETGVNRLINLGNFTSLGYGWAIYAPKFMPTASMSITSTELIAMPLGRVTDPAARVTFKGATKLLYIPPIAGWAPVSLESMFMNCIELRKIYHDLTTATNLDNAFRNCFELRNMPRLNWAIITSASYAFAYTDITGKVDINAPIVNTLTYLFLGTQIEELWLQAATATNIDYICNTCNRLRIAHVSAPGLSAAPNGMFNGCESLVSLSMKVPTWTNQQITVSRDYSPIRKLSCEFTEATSVTNVGTNVGYSRTGNLILEYKSSVPLSFTSFYPNYRVYRIVMDVETPPTVTNTTTPNLAFLDEMRVPAASVDAYKAHTYWSKFASKIVAI